MNNHPFSNRAEKMGSHMTAVGQRMTNLISAVESNHREMNQVIHQTSKFISIVQQIEHFSISALSTLIKQAVVHRIVGKVRAILQGIYQLTQESSCSLVLSRFVQGLNSHIHNQLNTAFAVSQYSTTILPCTTMAM